jgi:vacuolar-type H+-ATPase subunit C/Vma6
MHDSTLDLFEDAANAELAHHYAMMLEQRAAELEITVDYYLEEFHEI